MKARLYFLAFIKHDAPQFLVSGPYVSDTDALADLDAQELKHGLFESLGVVETREMEFAACEP